LGESGRAEALLEVEYDMLLTNRLILQPLLELNVSSQDDPERGLGSGVTTVEASLRLRYEITRQFAPYMGLVYERAYGETADFRRTEGEDVDGTRVVAGLRLWF
jgi:copper resistance protein B